MLANYGGTTDPEEQQTVDPKVDKKRKKDDAAATKVSLLLLTSYTERFLEAYPGQKDRAGSAKYCCIWHTPFCKAA
jgi:hypothetical protein